MQRQVPAIVQAGAAGTGLLCRGRSGLHAVPVAAVEAGMFRRACVAAGIENTSTRSCAGRMAPKGMGDYGHSITKNQCALDLNTVSRREMMDGLVQP